MLEITRPTSRCGPSNNLPLFCYVTICKKTVSKKPTTGRGAGQTFLERNFEAALEHQYALFCFVPRYGAHGSNALPRHSVRRIYIQPRGELPSTSAGSF